MSPSRVRADGGARRHRVHPLAPPSWRNRLVWAAAHASVRLLLRTVFRVRLADIAPLPDGPLVLAPNHRSFLDPFVVGALVERRVHFMMLAAYYDHPALRRLCQLARCLVVEGQGDERAGLRQAREVLAAGRALVIFPEGGISPDGALRPAQPGVAWLARRSGAPVYPVWLGGTREALCRGSWRLHLHPLQMRVGAPLAAAAFPPGRRGEDAFGRALTAAIAALAERPSARTGAPRRQGGSDPRHSAAS